jgi:hypothetical protein
MPEQLLVSWAITSLCQTDFLARYVVCAEGKEKCVPLHTDAMLQELVVSWYVPAYISVQWSGAWSRLKQTAQTRDFRPSARRNYHSSALTANLFVMCEIKACTATCN